MDKKALKPPVKSHGVENASLVSTQKYADTAHRQLALGFDRLSRCQVIGQHQIGGLPTRQCQRCQVGFVQG